MISTERGARLRREGGGSSGIEGDALLGLFGVGGDRYLNDLAGDIVAGSGSTIATVTHHIPSAQQVADHVGMLFRRNLVAFGKVDDMCDSWYAPCQEFLHGITEGPIGMSEERDRPEML